MNTLTYRQRRYFFAPLILIAIALFGLAVMWLWNSIMPVVFNLPVITFWQAAGLLILGRLFFGGGWSHHRWRRPYYSHELAAKLKNMSPEDRRAFVRKMYGKHGDWHHGDCHHGPHHHDDPQPENRDENEGADH